MIYYFSFWHQLQRREILKSGRCVFLLFICFLFPLIVAADPGPMELRAEAYRTYQSIEIDGDLNESDWQEARPISQFVQIEPVEGESITQPTEVRILYNEKDIYFGFTCFDSDTANIIANEMRRDGSGMMGLHENDNIYILLDTYNDKRSGFFFRTNPLGANKNDLLVESVTPQT